MVALVWQEYFFILFKVFKKICQRQSVLCNFMPLGNGNIQQVDIGIKNDSAFSGNDCLLLVKTTITKTNPL